MSATMTHDLQHAKDVVKANPDVALEALRDHAYKNWDAEAKGYFDELIAPQKDLIAVAPVAVSEPEMIAVAEPEPVVEQRTALTFFESIALPLIERLNVPVAPCYPSDIVHVKDGVEKKMGKTVHGGLVPSPLTMMSKDTTQIREWGQKSPQSNVCVYAQQVEGGLCFVDKDGKESLIAKYENETGRRFPETLLVCSSRLADRVKGHWYFRQTPRTMAAGNISEDKTGGLFSFRVKNMYVASIGSLHPETGKPYTIAQDKPVIPMPDDFLDWLQAQIISEPKTRDEAIKSKKFGKGERYPALMSELGRLWNRGYDRAGLVAAGLAWARTHFEVVGEFDEALVRGEIEHYADSYGDGENNDIILNQKPSPTQTAPVPSSELELSLDTSNGAVRPEFPLWAIKETSIYENLVRPAVATSSKFEEFIYMPALQIMANYLSRNVSIELQPTNLNLFVGLVSPFGQFFKSTSCELAYKYFECVGICGEMTKRITNAEGKVFSFQAGSPEGFGLRMFKANCRRAILFNDELGKFVSKAGIESSSFSSDLLTWYGSGSFGNGVKSEKDSFSFESGTYTFGWLWCTTDRGFNRHWPKLAGMSSGLGDRLFFCVSPEKPKPTGLYSDLSPDSMLKGALKTKERINRAIDQRTFQIEEPEMFSKRVRGMDPRSMDMVKKLALVLAIDLGLSTIDDDAVERAVALVHYRNQAAAYLEPIEADNVEGRLQKEVIRELRQNRGKISYRDLCRNLDFGRYGMRLWNAVYHGLKSHGDIVEFQETRTPGKRATRMVGLVKHDEDE